MNTLHTRREFLRTSALGAAAAWSVPLFLERTFSSLHAAAAESAIQSATGKDSPILIVLQLAGGNDGLNTLVPFEDDAYYRARPTLGIRKQNVLPVSGGLGFNDALAPFKALYDEGLLAVVQGVGYPNPNRSHFRSMEIWETATDSDKVSNTGWLGRYFDNCCSGADPTVGVAIGGGVPQAFASDEPTGVALSSPESYRWAGARGADAQMLDGLFRELNRPAADGDVDAAAGGGTIAAFEGGAPSGDNLDFIQRTGLDATVSSDTIREIAGRMKPGQGYPQGRFGDSLSLISRLIAGGLPTRVYYASQGGYDTHNNQEGTHRRLLTELGQGVAALLKDLKAQGNLDRVLLLTFSEFGRRVKENASGGTDHGAAAPVFVAGGAVRPGILGAAPDLANLKDGDLVHGIDFRSLYATILKGWLGADPAAVLGREFPALPLLR